MHSKYDEGAYYYTHLVFMWGNNATYNYPSIYCIKEFGEIHFPYLRSFLTKEGCACIYIPFYEKKLRVKI